MGWLESWLLFGELFLLPLLVYGVVESVLKGCEGTIPARGSHQLERRNLPRSQEIIPPRLVRQPAGPLGATRGVLRLAPVIDALLNILDIIDKLGSTALVSLELVLQTMTSRGPDMLGQTMLCLSDLGIGFSERKVSRDILRCKFASV